jgi:hypothetical protein
VGQFLHFCKELLALFNVAGCEAQNLWCDPAWTHLNGDCLLLSLVLIIRWTPIRHVLKPTEICPIDSRKLGQGCASLGAAPLVDYLVVGRGDLVADAVAAEDVANLEQALSLRRHCAALRCSSRGPASERRQGSVASSASLVLRATLSLAIPVPQLRPRTEVSRVLRVPLGVVVPEIRNRTTLTGVRLLHQCRSRKTHQDLKLTTLMPTDLLQGSHSTFSLLTI